jgi:transposase
LYKPIIKVKGLSIEYVDKVNEKYPMYKEIIDLVNDFRTILKSKAVIKINKWMDQASSLNNKFINSFINGINRDITAVKMLFYMIIIMD